jgi:hypothetical protein
MPVTLSDAIRRIRAKLDEPAYPTLPGSSPNNPPARFYSDTEITDWINDGLRDLARRAEFLFTYDTTISIPSYSQNPANPIPTYNLPTDFVRAYRIEFQVSGDSSQTYTLEEASQAYMDQIWNVNQISTRSYPAYYVTRGYVGGTGRNQFVIQLFPQPSQAGVLNIFYYRLPIRIGDPISTPTNYTLTLDCQEGWDDLVIDYGHYQGLIKARNPEWQNIKAEYETKMTNLIDVTRRYTDQPQYMSYDAMLMPWGGSDWGW